MYKIKELNWKIGSVDEAGPNSCHAQAFYGYYSVARYVNAWLSSKPGGMGFDEKMINHETLEDAKAACQQHHEKLIMESLREVTSEELLDMVGEMEIDEGYEEWPTEVWPPNGASWRQEAAGLPLGAPADRKPQKSRGERSSIGWYEHWLDSAEARNPLTGACPSKEALAS